MKLSIGLRLFIVMLTSIVGIATITLSILHQKYEDHFKDYTTKMELESLSELSNAIEIRYRSNKNWDFLPNNDSQKKDWIGEELIRIHEERVQQITRKKNNFPPRRQTHITSPSASLPELPPSPPILTAPLPTTANAVSKIPADGNPKNAFQDTSDLFSRITLLDINSDYLAGLKTNPSRQYFRYLYLDGHLIGYLLLKKSEMDSSSATLVFLNEQRSIILTVFLISICLSALVAYALSLHFGRPIQALRNGALQLSRGHYDALFKVTRGDELGELATSYNELAMRLKKAELSRQHWVADTSHELRTPLSVLRAQIESIQDGIRPITSDSLELLLRQVMTLNKLVDDLYSLNHAEFSLPKFQMHRLNLACLVIEVCANFQDKIRVANLNLDLSNVQNKPNAAFEIIGDPDRLRQVLSNLIENSIRYTNPTGLIQIKIENIADAVVLTIEDSEPGVPTSSLQHLSERFYRIESSRNREHGGSGLGLAVCREIIHAHDGQLKFTHSKLGGLCVTLSLSSIHTSSSNND